MLKSNIKIRLLGILVITVLSVVIGFKYLIPLFAPFIIAYFFAWILGPLVNFLHRKVKLPKIIASILSLIVFGALFIWGMITLINLFIKQAIILLKELPIYIAQLAGRIEGACTGCDNLLGIEVGTMKGVFDSNMDNVLVVVKTKVIPTLTSRGLSLAIGLVEIAGILLVIVVTTLLLLKDKGVYLNSLRESIFYKEIRVVTSKLSETGIAYLKTQAILMVLIAFICSVALFLIQNKYALLIGLGIGIFDAFPLLGSGLILVPWGIISLIGQDVKQAAILITLYVVCQLIRQFLEPKLLGNQMGILPVFTLMSMYVGLRIFGLAGFILGPIGLIVIVTVMSEARTRMASTNIKDE